MSITHDIHSLADLSRFLQRLEEFSCQQGKPRRLKPNSKTIHLPQRWKRCATQNQCKIEFFRNL
jgi:hypothetical protein